MTMETALQFDMVNDIVLQAVKHGADGGGSYDSNTEGLTRALEIYAVTLDPDAKVEIVEVREEHPKYISVWFIPQIVWEDNNEEQKRFNW